MRSLDTAWRVGHQLTAMDESVFEWMEQARVVDRVLLGAAVVLPLALAVAYRVLRNRPVVLRQRHRWAMGVLAAPALFVLWKVYNAICDQYGLDSVFGFFVNLAIFALVTLVAAGLNFFLYMTLSSPPPVRQPAAKPPPPPAV